MTRQRSSRCVASASAYAPPRSMHRTPGPTRRTYPKRSTTRPAAGPPPWATTPHYKAIKSCWTVLCRVPLVALLWRCVKGSLPQIASIAQPAVAAVCFDAPVEQEPTERRHAYAHLGLQALEVTRVGVAHRDTDPCRQVARLLGLFRRHGRQPKCRNADSQYVLTRYCGALPQFSAAAIWLPIRRAAGRGNMPQPGSPGG